MIPPRRVPLTWNLPRPCPFPFSRSEPFTPGNISLEMLCHGGVNFLSTKALTLLFCVLATSSSLLFRGTALFTDGGRAFFLLFLFFLAGPRFIGPFPLSPFFSLSPQPSDDLSPPIFLTIPFSSTRRSLKMQRRRHGEVPLVPFPFGSLRALSSSPQGSPKSPRGDKRVFASRRGSFLSIFRHFSSVFSVLSHRGGLSF